MWTNKLWTGKITIISFGYSDMGNVICECIFGETFFNYDLHGNNLIEILDDIVSELIVGGDLISDEL